MRSRRIADAVSDSNNQARRGPGERKHGLPESVILDSVPPTWRSEVAPMSTHPVEKQRAETRAPQAAEKRTGLTFRRHFTTAGRHPFDEVTWERRSAVINDEK